MHWRVRLWRTALAWLLSSGLTHPFAWNAAYLLAPEAYAAGWCWIEFAVTCVEAGVFVLIMRIGVRKGLFLSVLANGFSAVAGLWLLGG